MSKKPFPALQIATAVLVGCIVAGPAHAALETPLLVNGAPSAYNVPYLQTHWYGFSATSGQGYRILLTPSAGNPNLYVLNASFGLAASSVNGATAVEKVWVSGSAASAFHIGAYGAYNPSSNYTIQVITAPVISNISPTSGVTGALVTITGVGFGATQGTSSVKFGSVSASSYLSWTNTQIKVYVPNSAPAGYAQLTVLVNGISSNAKTFTVTAGPSSAGGMWRYDLARTGNYPNGPTAFPLSLKWIFQVYNVSGRTYRAYYLGGRPVIVNNTMYLPHLSYEGFNAPTGVAGLLAINATDGTLIWQYQLPSVGTPTVANGIVYVSAGYDVVALNATSGSLIWRYSIGNTLSFSVHLVANGIVYAAGKATTSDPSTPTVYALDAATGALKWRYAAGTIWTPAAWANNLLYLTPEYGGTVIALDAATGALKWTGSTATRTSAPVVSNGVLYAVGVDGPLGSPTGTRNLIVYAFNASTGVLQWSYIVETSTEVNTSNVVISPALSGTMLYFGTPRTDTYAVDLASKTLKWRFRSSASPTYANSNSPTVSNNVVYVASYDHNDITGNSPSTVYALDATTGAVKWSYAAPTLKRAGTVAVDAGKVYTVGDYIEGHTDYGDQLYVFGP